jgi:hypothetical protein
MKRARKPITGKVCRTEHVEAVTFWKMVTMHEGRYPDLKMLFAVPNGGARNPIVARKMKSEGVRAGVSDYVALVPAGDYHGLAIELKTIDGRSSSEQRDFLRNARALGYRAELAHGWVEAWRIVCEHFGIPNGVEPR